MPGSHSFFKLFLLFGALILSCPGKSFAQKPVTDTTVERLINRSRYEEASKLIGEKLKSTPESDIDRTLYYKNRLSIAQLRLRNIDAALKLGLEALALSKKSEDSTLVVDAWKSVSYAYNNAGKLDSALYFTRLMLAYGERNKDDKLCRNAFTSLGTILSQNKRYDEAMQFFRNAQILTMKMNDSLNFSVGNLNIGLNFLHLKNNDSCLYYLSQAAVLAKKFHQDDNLIYIYGMKADCYLVMKNYSEQKKYLLLANKIAEKIGNRQFLAMGFSNLTTGAVQRGNFREAIDYGMKALSLLREQPYPVLQMKVDSMMYFAYKESGDITKALSFLESFIIENEQVKGEKQKQELNELMLPLKVKEKDLTIANQLVEITEKRRFTQVLILIIFIFILLAVGQFIYIQRNRRFRKELYKKEKYLDREIMEIRLWMEWRHQKEKETEKQHESQKTLDDGEVSKEKPAFSSHISLFTELRDIFDSQKLYLDPELNIKSVIKILGTNQKYLYQAISENSDSNFRSFVNRYRVDEAKKIIQQKIIMKEILNLSEIYIASGFNSSVSFYRAFRAVTGLTPKDYAAEIRSEMSGQQK